MFTLVKGEDVLADTAKVYRICSDQKPKVISTLKVKSFKSNGKSNIFRQSFGVKKMARQAGQRANARGFNYTSKSVRQKEVWPYPGPKASFHVMWKYKLSLCTDASQLALLFSGFVRLLKWDLVTEVPSYIQGDKLSWTANSFNDEEQIKQYEIKNKRFIPGSGRLRCEYEMNIKDVQNETNEIIPRRDQRAVEAIERSGRTLRRTIKPIEEVVQRDQDICMWITEEKMEVWQIDLYHRNTEDDGIHIQRNSSAIGSRPNDRFNLRDREKIRPPRPADDYSPDYTPDRDLMPTPSRSVRRNQNYANSPVNAQPEMQRTDRNSIMMPRNRPPQGLNQQGARPVNQVRYVRDSMGRQRQVDSPSSYTPQNTPPPQRRPGGGGASATNVRITKAILDSILLNPEHFTQITHDKPPHLCTFLKLASPDDARQFKGGKNYQTTIQGRVKQIFSYIPQDPAMYQFMVQRELVLRPAPTQPRQPSAPMNGNNNHPVDDKQHVKSLVDNLVEKVATETENSYITGQARIGLNAREKLESKMKKVRDNIYQERVKLVQGYAKKLQQQQQQNVKISDSSNSPAGVPPPPQQQQQQQPQQPKDDDL